MESPTPKNYHEIAKVILGDNGYSHPDKTSDSAYAAYFGHYNNIFPPGRIIVMDGKSTPALKTHDEVLTCINSLTGNWNLTREGLIIVKGAFTGETPGGKEEALKKIAKVVFMMDCESQECHASDQNMQPLGSPWVHWGSDQTFARFVEEAFITTVGGRQIGEAAVPLQTNVAKNLKTLRVFELVYRLKVKIIPTNNLLEHLLYDSSPGQPTLKVFHHSMFLQGQLKLCKEHDVNIDATFEESLRNGVLPPMLVLETLCSIYGILFLRCSTWKKGKRQLNELWGKGGIDLGALKPLSLKEIFDPIPGDFRPTYTFWGSRLTELYEAVQNPPPRRLHSVVDWLERHGSDRHKILLAIVSLIFAAIFGLGSLIVGIISLARDYDRMD